MTVQRNSVDRGHDRTSEPGPGAAWVDKAARDGRGRIAPAEGGLRVVHQLVLRSIAATGQLPASAAIDASAAACGRAGAQVLAELQQADFLRLDARGAIKQVYPFSLIPTAHRVQIQGGPLVYAMCAIDALGIAAMLSTAVTVTSSDARTGERVTVEVTAGGHEATWSPATTVVFNGHKRSSCEATPPGTPAVGLSSAADCRCESMIFFTSAASAAAWAQAHPEVAGEILDGPQALRLGREIFGPMLTACA